MDTKRDNVYGPGTVTPLMHWEQGQLLSLVIAICVTLISIVLLVLFRKRKQTRNCILFLGLSDAGKTQIFVRLAYKKCFDTYTSMQVNLSGYQTSKKNLKLIDIPGQERVRNRIFDDYKIGAHGIVYVIDSLTIQKQLRDVAEFLYTILADETIKTLKPPLLVLCNKQDAAMAKGSSAIRSLLEKEINILRKTKTSQLDSIDKKTKRTFLGKRNKDFEFDHLDLQISFAESTAVKTSEESPLDLEQLEDWIENMP